MAPWSLVSSVAMTRLMERLNGFLYPRCPDCAINENIDPKWAVNDAGFWNNTIVVKGQKSRRLFLKKFAVIYYRPDTSLSQRARVHENIQVLTLT